MLSPIPFCLGRKHLQPGSEAGLIKGRAGARWVGKAALLLIATFD